MSSDGETEEIRAFGDWFVAQPHRHKVVIAGNHDFLIEDEPARAQALLRDGTYLPRGSPIFRNSATARRVFCCTR